MAKKQAVSNYPYPTRFGTHRSMVLGEVDNNGMVPCGDEFGQYLTHYSNIDSGRLDPARTDSRRLGKLFGGKKE
jgi:hypothetical protein